MSTESAIEQVGVSPNEADSNGEPANLVDGLFAIARAIRKAADLLGNGDAATPMGAIEAFGKVMMDGMERIAGALGDVSSALDEVSKSVDGVADTLEAIGNGGTTGAHDSTAKAP